GNVEIPGVDDFLLDNGLVGQGAVVLLDQRGDGLLSDQLEAQVISRDGFQVRIDGNEPDGLIGAARQIGQATVACPADQPPCGRHPNACIGRYTVSTAGLKALGGKGQPVDTAPVLRQIDIEIGMAVLVGPGFSQLLG